jgi:hypothetical protein
MRPSLPEQMPGTMDVSVMSGRGHVLEPSKSCGGMGARSRTCAT